ncbi:hypothetical protein KCP78_19740 [Salmonella enterica subsp. enterica]|nr:hypothetical protein KCP78_19740 [Salmonella enterica subsp. enterica]
MKFDVNLGLATGWRITCWGKELIDRGAVRQSYAYTGRWTFANCSLIAG